MAEFCIACENRMMGEEYEPITPGDVVTDWDYCEGCGQWCECIVAFEPWYHGPKRKQPPEAEGPGLLEYIKRIFRRKGGE